MHSATKNNHSKILICLGILAIVILVLITPLFLHASIGYANLGSRSIGESLAYTNTEHEYDADPNYATKEYWDQHFKGEKHYIDNLQPGDTISSGDYFINHDITVDASQENCPGIIIKGNVTLYFEKETAESIPPCLTVIGGDSSWSSQSFPGISLTEESKTQINTLYIKGSGNVNITGGDKNDNDYEKAVQNTQGKVGSEAADIKDKKYCISGSGGAGGNGTSGAAAAIGTDGGKAGNGAAETAAVRAEYVDDERCDFIETYYGNHAKYVPNTQNGKSSKSIGKFKVSGNIKLNCTSGTVLVPTNEVPKPIAGKIHSRRRVWDWFQYYWVFCCDGATGGNGGFGFRGAAIGSGGSGGSGGGAGGSGDSVQISTWTTIDNEWWYAKGGPGGPGTGSVLSKGGSTNAFDDEKDTDFVNKPKDAANFDSSNPPKDTSKWCLGETGASGGSPSIMLEKLPEYGGNGCQGGISQESINNNPVISSMDINY